MEYSFICYGHKNITAKHRTTLEFTKDKDVSLKGDCIIGVGADFSLKEIKKFVKDKANANKKTINKIPIKIIIGINNLKEEINGFLNTGFDDPKEIVVRKSDFKSKRTLVFLADKGAFELNRDLIGFLKEEKSKIKVIIKGC